MIVQPVIPKLRDGIEYQQLKFIFEGISPIEMEINKAHVNIFTDRGYSFKSESNQIKELNKVPTEKHYNEMLEELTAIYKNSFPRGANDLASGGCHLHLFCSEADKGFMESNIDTDKLNKNFLNTLLFCKIIRDEEDGQLYLTTRGMHMTQFSRTRIDNDNSKGDAMTLKDHGLSTGAKFNSLEFRLNNVYHKNIHMYYRLILMNNFFKIGMKFKSMPTKVKNSLKKGLAQTNYSGPQLDDNVSNIGMKEIKAGWQLGNGYVKLEGEVMEIFMYNLMQLVSLERRMFDSKKIINYFYSIIS